MNFLGIDPGNSGAMTLIDDDGNVIDSVKLSETEHDVAAWLSITVGKSFIDNHTIFAALEKVSATPQMGVTSSFTFGKSYGFLRGLLAANGIKYIEVSPMKWQGAMGCQTGGQKNISKAAAQRLWPNRTWTHATADSALIAEYARRTERTASNRQNTPQPT